MFWVFLYWLDNTQRFLQGSVQLSHMLRNESQSLSSCTCSFHQLSHYSHGCQKCLSSVWFSPDIDICKITRRQLSHTPGGSEWPKHNMRMYFNKYTNATKKYYYNIRCITYWFYTVYVLVRGLNYPNALMASIEENMRLYSWVYITSDKMTFFQPYWINQCVHYYSNYWK